jgi:hypothetical protein
VINRIRSKNELNEAAKSYRSGKYPDAEAHARRALQLDPTSKIAPAFIARSIHAQYRPGGEDEENKTLATRAIAAYKEILQKDPSNPEAYRAVVALLRALNQTNELRQFITNKANDNKATPTERAEAFTVLASQDWDCSFQVTESAETKKELPDGKFQYVKPADGTKFQQAKDCAQRGMQEIESGIGFDPNSETAWSYKTNLLLEKAKLAEMDGNADQAKQLNAQAEQALAKTKELNRIAEEKKAAAATPTPSPAK